MRQSLHRLHLAGRCLIPGLTSSFHQSTRLGAEISLAGISLVQCWSPSHPRSGLSRTTSTRWPTPGFPGSICGPGVITRADFTTPPQSQIAEFGGTQKLWHRSSRSNRFVDEGTQTNQEVDLYEQDHDNHSSVRSVTSAHSLHLASHGTAPVYQFDSFPPWRE